MGPMTAAQVEELQGLYGPFSLSERVIQRIWARGDFCQEDLRTTAGQDLEVLEPGRWNHQEGPDFKEARLRLDGKELRGDVEIHFKPADWLAHGHEANPNFERVVLHVVLQPDGGPLCRTRSGRELPTLVLLPLLDRDLESHAMDDALLDLERVNELAWVDDFLALEESERLRRLDQAAAQRWRQKLAFARKRLAVHGWEEACHLSILEVLGYARNRAPMHRIALEHPRADFAAGIDVDALYRSQEGRWKRQGLRPANHPKKRLLQYAEICRACPDWPAALAGLLETCRAPDAEGTRRFRATAGCAALREQVAAQVFGGHLGGTRLDTLFADAIWPLAGAREQVEVEPFWQHWYPGDVPDRLPGFLREAGLLSTEHPKSNGRCQGALGLFLCEGEPG